MGEAEFWSLTAEELRVRLEKIAERTEARERAATLRAGLVTSAIYNVHRRKGSRAFRPEDFVRTPVQYVDGKTLRNVVRDWLNKGAAEA